MKITFRSTTIFYKEHKLLHSTMKNTNLMLFFFALQFSMIFLGCENNKHGNESDSNGDFIEFYYRSPNALYPMSFNCGRVYGGPLPEDSDSHYLSVNDTTFLNDFSIALKEVKTNDTMPVNIDAKIQILAHINNRTDTICMDRISGIMVNSKFKKDSKPFHDLIITLILKDYNSKPRRF